MCTALEELKKEGRTEGITEGIIKGRILAYFELGVSPEEIARKTKLTVKEVEKILEENGELNLV